MNIKQKKATWCLMNHKNCHVLSIDHYIFLLYTTLNSYTFTILGLDSIFSTEPVGNLLQSPVQWTYIDLALTTL